MSRRCLLACLFACALALGACGSSGGADDDVALLVTHDFGATQVDQAGPAPVQAGDSIAKLLGDTFPQVAAQAKQRSDWSAFVNGVGLTEDAAEVQVHGGDRIWWDRHDTRGTPPALAVVGSYPEPFIHGLNGERWPLRVECARHIDKGPCNDVAERLGKIGAIGAQSLVGADGGKTNMRVEVGPWDAIRVDRAARLVDLGPAQSGVFARFSDDGAQLALLDATGKTVRTLGAGTGLIAATRYEDEPPTWLVTGTDMAGVQAAAAALDEAALADRFAVAVSGGRAIALPVRS